MNNIILVLLALLINGCVAAAIGSYAYTSSKSKEVKQQFMANYNQTNIEREKEGLAPLDLCTEQYHFDKGWADDDPNCAKRIAEYESGNTDALGKSKMENTNDAESSDDTNTNK